MTYELLFDKAPMAQTGGPELLDHDLNKYFPELLKLESSDELAKSAVYREIREGAERILNAVVVENLSEPPLSAGRQPRKSSNWPAAYAAGSDIRALAWNIERGNIFEGIVDALRNHNELKDKDLLLLTELDFGMARSKNRFVAREIAEALNLNYAFAPVYIALQKGSGVESEIEGENTFSIHGLAMFSKWPMKNIHGVALPNGKDKMWGKEKRLGHLRALIADIEHPSGVFRAVTVHLDAHCSRAHRHRQMKIILDHLDTLRPLPTLIGGDWNTTTFNSQNATRAILGYWRRVLMGVKNVVKNHYPHPDHYFEKELFGEIESRGYDYKSLNEIGAGTIHYDVESIEKNNNLRDWVPEWCFPFIFWAANRVGGRVSGRLDWFAGKMVELAPYTAPKTIGNLINGHGTPLSDHDAITLDFRLKVK
ncbi:MAG: hypothetical protein DMF62_10675 [Acidobacteria bacterium]|nr:MAG: hypothetical protein DMF62_10675 [Acidobacteriota bacterium]